MKIILSDSSHVPGIMKIIDDAKRYLASKNIDQWQNGYPNEEQIRNDIANQESYVVVNADGAVMGTTMFTTNSEPTYKVIERGEWIVDESKPYGVIHRMAVNDDFRGRRGAAAGCRSGAAPGPRRRSLRPCPAAGGPGRCARSPPSRPG